MKNAAQHMGVLRCRNGPRDYFFLVVAALASIWVATML